MTKARLRFPQFWILVALAGISPTALSAVSAERVLKAVDAWRFPGGTLSFAVSVKDYDGNTLAGETRYRVYTKGTRYARIETEFPERQRGRKLLMRGADLWLYLPTIKRPTRVSFQQRLTGEVANGDLARISFSEDYRAQWLSSPKSAPQPRSRRQLASAAPANRKKAAAPKANPGLLTLRLTAKHKDSTYRRIDLWVEPKTYVPRKAHYYALSGKLLKVSEFSEPRPAMGRTLLSRTVIRDALNRSRRSVLDYAEYRPEKLADTFFTKESLP